MNCWQLTRRNGFTLPQPLLEREGGGLKRRGLTLMELLLVIAIMVAVGALVYPSLERPFAADRLRRAGDQIRAHWSKARNRAIDSGEVYVFRCQLQGSRYLIERYAGLDIETTQSSGFGVNATQTSASTTPTLTIDKSLPKDVTISGFQTEADARSSQQAMEFGTADPSQSRDEIWSTEPVLFFPDGTCTAAELTLKNEYGATVVVSLRGLTGASRLGEVSAGSEERAAAEEER
jgi:prepilin-type N-terminal cleavage/methylation domain-containing protein